MIDGVSSKKSSNNDHKSSIGPRRIAVIGAGISGLAAAHRVQELAPDASLTIFEAADLAVSSKQPSVTAISSSVRPIASLPSTRGHSIYANVSASPTN
jgi:hypothetical protein